MKTADCLISHILFGMKRTISGKRTSKTAQNIIAAINGSTPLKICVIGTSVTEPSAKTFKPTGGVTKPISWMITIITPNHMGSNPNPVTTGYIMGTVKITAESISRNIPRIIKCVNYRLVLQLHLSGTVCS